MVRRLSAFAICIEGEKGIVEGFKEGLHRERQSQTGFSTLYVLHVLPLVIIISANSPSMLLFRFPCETCLMLLSLHLISLALETPFQGVNNVLRLTVPYKK